MNKIIVDAAFSLSLLLGSVYLWFVADAFPKVARYKNIDTDFWPKILLGMVGVLAIVLCYQSLSALRALRQAKVDTNAGATAVQAPNIDWMKLLRAAGLVLLYFLGLQTLGFIISTIIFLALAINVLGYGNVLVRRIFPFVFTAIVTAVFVKILSMPLPRGWGVFETFSRIFY